MKGRRIKKKDGFTSEADPVREKENNIFSDAPANDEPPSPFKTSFGSTEPFDWSKIVFEAPHPSRANSNAGKRNDSFGSPFSKPENKQKEGFEFQNEFHDSSPTFSPSQFFGSQNTSFATERSSFVAEETKAEAVPTWLPTSFEVPNIPQGPDLQTFFQTAFNVDESADTSVDFKFFQKETTGDNDEEKKGEEKKGEEKKGEEKKGEESMKEEEPIVVEQKKTEEQEEERNVEKEDDDLDLIEKMEMLTLEKLQLEVVAGKAERLVHDLEMEKNSNAFLRSRIDVMEEDALKCRGDSIKYYEMYILEKQRKDEKTGDSKLVQDFEKAKQEIERLKKEMETQVQEMEKRTQAQLATLKKSDKEKSDVIASLTEKASSLEKDLAKMKGSKEREEQKIIEAKELTESKIVEFEMVLKREGVIRFLKFLYQNHPPKNKNHKLGPLTFDKLDKTLKVALIHYHTDKQDLFLYGAYWMKLCEGITRILNECRDYK